jgi:2,3-bisphosphoglycerate-dependent phosphoglycerate mutase
VDESSKTRAYHVGYVGRISVVAAMALVFCLCCFWSFWLSRPTRIMLVRHAERAAGDGNVNLSDDEGLPRAEALVAVANEAGVTAVYSTKWCRNAQTAQPLVLALGLPLHVQGSADPQAGLGSCAPPVSAMVIDVHPEVVTSTEVVKHVLGEHRGRTVLIVGHSNTVPEMVAALGEGTFAPVAIGPDDFDKLFVVTVRRFPFFKSFRLIKARYGK